MIAIETVNNYVTGIFPDTVARNSTGAATQDGFEFIAEYIDNSVIGPQQAIMDYAGLTPDGVTESAAASQMIEALGKGLNVGPGLGSTWFLDDDPSVSGHRALLLTEQGVLVASYPELVDACWIGGVDADQVAAKAAGAKFWRSDNAVGTTPLAAGPYLQLPAGNNTFFKTYSEAAGDFTVTATNWTTNRAICLPYKTSNDIWRLIFNINGALSVASATTILTISGITSVAVRQAISISQNNAAGTSINQQRLIQSGGNLDISFSATVDAIALSGDIELNSKPTWAADVVYPQCITY